VAGKNISSEEETSTKTKTRKARSIRGPTGLWGRESLKIGKSVRKWGTGRRLERLRNHQEVNLQQEKISKQEKKTGNRLNIIGIANGRLLQEGKQRGGGGKVSTLKENHQKAGETFFERVQKRYKKR